MTPHVPPEDKGRKDHPAQEGDLPAERERTGDTKRESIVEIGSRILEENIDIFRELARL